MVEVNVGYKVADPPIHQSHRLAEAILLMPVACHERANDVAKACLRVRVCISDAVSSAVGRYDALTRA